MRRRRADFYASATKKKSGTNEYEHRTLPTPRRPRSASRNGQGGTRYPVQIGAFFLTLRVSFIAGDATGKP